MIKAFEDSVDRYPPEFATIDRLRAATQPRLSLFYDDTQRPDPLHSLTTTDNEPLSIKFIQESEV